jgi:hypothetical protein
MTLQTISIPGANGAHGNANGQDCYGRIFEVNFAGIGAVYHKQVSCTVCGQEFLAYETALGPRPEYPVLRPQTS